MSHAFNTLKSLAALAVCAVFGVTSAPAQDVCVSHLPVGGQLSVTSNNLSEPYQVAADDFSLASDCLVTKIRWWGTSNNDDILGMTDNFTVAFYVAVNGLPAVSFADRHVGDVTPVATGLFNSAGFPVFQYEATLATPVALTASTHYFVSIRNTVNPTDDWFWHTSTPGTWYQFTDSTGWNEQNAFNLAFELLGRSTCTYDLIADGGSPDTAVVVGSVTIAYDAMATAWNVTYQTTGTWWITATHLDAQCNPNSFPMTRQGNPKVGQFRYQDYGYAQQVTYMVPDLGCDPVAFAAHAVVVDASDCYDTDGDGINDTCREETAWAAEYNFPGNNWAMWVDSVCD